MCRRDYHSTRFDAQQYAAATAAAIVMVNRVRRQTGLSTPHDPTCGSSRLLYSPFSATPAAVYEKPIEAASSSLWSRHTALHHYHYHHSPHHRALSVMRVDEACHDTLSDDVAASMKLARQPTASPLLGNVAVPRSVQSSSVDASMASDGAQRLRHFAFLYSSITKEARGLGMPLYERILFRERRLNSALQLCETTSTQCAPISERRSSSRSSACKGCCWGVCEWRLAPSTALANFVEEVEAFRWCVSRQRTRELEEEEWGGGQHGGRKPGCTNTEAKEDDYVERLCRLLESCVLVTPFSSLSDRRVGWQVAMQCFEYAAQPRHEMPSAVLVVKLLPVVTRLIPEERLRLMWTGQMLGVLLAAGHIVTGEEGSPDAVSHTGSPSIGGVMTGLSSDAQDSSSSRTSSTMTSPTTAMTEWGVPRSLTDEYQAAAKWDADVSRPVRHDDLNWRRFRRYTQPQSQWHRVARQSMRRKKRQKTDGAV